MRNTLDKVMLSIEATNSWKKRVRQLTLDEMAKAVGATGAGMSDEERNAKLLQMLEEDASLLQEDAEAMPDGTLRIFASGLLGCEYEQFVPAHEWAWIS